MKFVCNRCRKFVSSEDVIIEVIDVNSVRLAINVYCEDCFKSKEKNKKLPIDFFEKKLKEKAMKKRGFIENWIKRIKQLK